MNPAFKRAVSLYADLTPNEPTVKPQIIRRNSVQSALIHAALGIIDCR